MGNSTSEIIIGNLRCVNKFCNRKVIITDKNVLKHHKNSFPQGTVIPIDVGEKMKTLDTIKQLYEKFLDYKIDRYSLIVGIGGGVICDITGFASSTYLRGIEFGFVPTTLLAQADASIGGKNGVNFIGYKNIIGTFNKPKFVICDFELLKTLPINELKCGFAEIIKHAVIADKNYFSYLENHWQGVFNLDLKIVEHVVLESIRIKSQIVSEDEKEKGRRYILNFGHTFGHAIEKITSYNHGQAISIGMVMAAKLSNKLGFLSYSEINRLEKLIKDIGLPVDIQISKNEIIQAIWKDKKRNYDKIHFVFLSKIGKAFVKEIEINKLENLI